jgi:hypothetical protein
VLDWTSWNRKADCLARMGDTAGATEIRERAAAIGQRIDQDRLLQIRDLLQNLGDPQAVQEVSDYYRALGRTREADCWANYLARLKAAPPAEGANGEAADFEMQPSDERPVGELPDDPLRSDDLPAVRSGIDGPDINGPQGDDPANQGPANQGPANVDSTEPSSNRSEGTPPSAASDSDAEPSAR